jgi:hypothetical protein
MNETVTVDKAISKGHWMVNLPVFIIMIGTIGLCLYLGTQNILPPWIYPVGFGLGFGLAWLWWSVMITKWRLWAFENVRNVHELKKRAINENLIWPDNSFFEKTELRGARDKEKWSLLKRKFKIEDLFKDDISVPNETKIFYSKGLNFFEMIMMIGCIGFGIYLIIKFDSYFFGTLLSIFGAYFGYKEFKEATNTEPQIILNEKGIKTISTRFYEWEEIKNEEVISQGSGRYIRYYLVYNYPNGREYLKIDDFETNQSSLNKLLTLYRGRNRNSIMIR